MLARSEIRGGCEKCKDRELAEEENSVEQLEKAVCTRCPWDKTISPLVPYLNQKLEEQDGGCPIGRHELLDEHWRYLGYMKPVRQKYWADQAKLRAEQAEAKKKAIGG